MTQDELWNAKWCEVKAFMEANHRNPSKYDDTERGLYLNWIKHNKRRYSSGELKEDRRARFEELLALSERYRRKNQWE